MRTCSLECVRQHKIDENCTGKRDPAKRVEKKEMNDRMLLSDYRFLEDANRHVYGIQRSYEVNFKPYPKTNRNNILHQQSMARGFVLWTLPDGMSKKTENTTVISTVSGLLAKNKKPLKLFHFHIKWTLDQQNHTETVLNTKIIETWNVGKIAENVLDSVSDKAEFAEVKSELIEEPISVENDDESSGHFSGGSVTVAESSHTTTNAEYNAMCKPIEPGKERFIYNVFMKRITGPESYYLFSAVKSLRENLEGKAIVEYPELILAPPSKWEYYHARLTEEVDYRKGKKPQRPDHVNSKEPKEHSNKEKWKSKVNMAGVELEDWQKEALHGGNKRKKKNKKKEQKKTEPAPHPALQLNGPEREERSIGFAEDVKKVSAPPVAVKPVEKTVNPPPPVPVKKAKSENLRFFDMSQISSDSE